jgi:hypothetical protein
LFLLLARQNLEPHQSNEEIQLWGSDIKDTIFIFRSNFKEIYDINMLERVWIQFMKKSPYVRINFGCAD